MLWCEKCGHQMDEYDPDDWDAVEIDNGIDWHSGEFVSVCPTCKTSLEDMVDAVKCHVCNEWHKSTDTRTHHGVDMCAWCLAVSLVGDYKYTFEQTIRFELVDRFGADYKTDDWDINSLIKDGFQEIFGGEK